MLSSLNLLIVRFGSASSHLQQYCYIDDILSPRHYSSAWNGRSFFKKKEIKYVRYIHSLPIFTNTCCLLAIHIRQCLH